MNYKRQTNYYFRQTKDSRKRISILLKDLDYPNVLLTEGPGGYDNVTLVKNIVIKSKTNGRKDYTVVITDTWCGCFC